MDNLSAIETTRKNGDEPFEFNGTSLPMDLLSFWQWSSSDIVGNAMRGILAEYIVASSVGMNSGIRTEWDAFDIETPEGIKVEVKSGAYVQSWEQKKHSTIQFSIRPTQGWDSESNERNIEVRRQADVYVFCLLKHKDQTSINPLNLDQWVFYVLPTGTLNQSVGAQKSITLNSLESLNPSKVKYGELHASIKAAANK
ncbi:hypothetical protein [Gilvimarinus polysaccharolyticus]|uniref:hypothetical protein n=1 Tax=Gilvimarinus polysaccharolyticus TaxID=863921 RepID=UPI00067332D0|nr:hypothetical protein [Gilvimarinus polysaccharolyticus]